MPIRKGERPLELLGVEEVGLEDLKAELAGKEPLKRRGARSELSTALERLEAGRGLRVRYRGDFERGRSRVFNAVMGLQRRERAAGRTVPQFLVYDGKDSSFLVFRTRPGEAGGSPPGS